MPPSLLSTIDKIKRSKYLERYSETEVERLRDFPILGEVNPIVVPVYNESPDFFETAGKSLSSDKPILWIVVINVPSNASPQAELNTRQIQYRLASMGECLFQTNGICLIEQSEKQKFLIIDRISDPIPKQQGVGLARKIGCDAACQLLSSGKLKYRWIATTDADALLPENYFSIIERETGYTSNPTHPGVAHSALTFPFAHINPTSMQQLHEHPSLHASFDRSKLNFSDALNIATYDYERHLNYYVAGLKFANSPYAYHSLGSIIILDPLAYCMARGFPKRAAGEDFHLLNKLSKIAPVKSLKTAPILIQARVSDRVPFGTGPAVSNLMIPSNNTATLGNIESNHFQVKTMPTYHPAAFGWLKQWLNLLTEIAHQKPNNRLRELKLGFNGFDFDVERINTTLQLVNSIEKINRQFKTDHTFLKACYGWFDALKTVRFLNLACKEHLGRVPINDVANHFDGHPTT